MRASKTFGVVVLLMIIFLAMIRFLVLRTEHKLSNYEVKLHDARNNREETNQLKQDVVKQSKLPNYEADSHDARNNIEETNQLQYSVVKQPKLPNHEADSHDVRNTIGKTNQLKYDVVKQQRNELSKLLNELKQEIGVMSCEMNGLQKKLNKSVSIVSVAGGWCRKASESKGGNHRFDRSLAEELSHFFASKRVASFGDGPGDYKKYMDSTKRVAVYDAYDGAPYGPETSGGVVKFLDLTAPQYGLPVYDWVMSLEVAEHIPGKYEPIYIDNIVRHASSGIVLSWAVPGQGGLSHVNNKPLSYVKDILSSKGFDIDMEVSNSIRKQATFFWLKDNVYIYRRREDTPLLPENA